MNFKLLCVFASLAVFASAYPHEFNYEDREPYPKDLKDNTRFIRNADEIELHHRELIPRDNYPNKRFRRSPQQKQDEEKQPDFRFKAKVEDSKLDGRSISGSTQWKAWESDNGRHKVEAYADGYYREGGDKFRFQPNQQKDSNYRVGGTYEYTCC